MAFYKTTALKVLRTQTFPSLEKQNNCKISKTFSCRNSSVWKIQLFSTLKQPIYLHIC